jgi:hypothetical protein
MAVSIFILVLIDSISLAVLTCRKVMINVGSTVKNYYLKLAKLQNADSRKIHTNFASGA